jgi:hypothetical protein
MLFKKIWARLVAGGMPRSEAVRYARKVAPAAAQGIQEGMAAALTDEENYQLQRIKEVLQEAGDKARDGGLV